MKAIDRHLISALTLGLSLALALGTVYAQPKPTPAPAPAPGAGSGSDAGSGEKERPGTNESLQNGGDTRPWASGVSPSEQRDALKHWDHPAIHYNLALAQMELAQPIEAYDNLTTAIKYGDAPLQSKDKF